MIYFDSAATTLQKPREVPYAVAHAIQTCASPGRGDYAASGAAEQILFHCREELCGLFDVDDPAKVIFTLNATHALNIAIRTMVKPGDRVLISGWEHNAVTRTLYSIPSVEVLVADAPLFDDKKTLDAFSAQLELHPSVVICTCVSNVFGYILPFNAIADLCRSKEIPLILDASQAAGCVSMSVKKTKADFIAFPGHKGLYGPQGTGVLLCAGSRMPDALLTGGTGSESINQQMPNFLPDIGESGTHNVAGIAGLLAGVRFVRRKGIERIAQHEKRLVRRLAEQLPNTLPLTPYLSPTQNQSGVLSLRCDGLDCQQLASALGQAGICVRAGLHCAPLAHKSAGTLECGTLRVSFSAFNHFREIDRFIYTISHIVHSNLI